MGIGSSVSISMVNWVDFRDSEITGSGDVPTLPASNLSDDHGYRVYRDDALASADAIEFTVSFGRAVPLGVLAFSVPRTSDFYFDDLLIGISEAETVEHYLDNDDTGTGAVYASGAVASNVFKTHGYHVHELPEEFEATHWRCRIVLSDPLKLRGWADIARAWAGPLYKPECGFDFGDTRAWASDSVLLRARRGISDLVDHVEPLQNWDMGFGFVPEQDAEFFDDFERVTNTARQFLIGRSDLAEGKNWMFARHATGLGLSSAAHLSSTKTLRVTEAI